ncbi:MAG: glycosyltransferase family 2 protein [Spirochaetota bacterium]
MRKTTQKAKISIIIPVYSVEPYLRPCLESVVSQSLRQIEIIVVNDASPDNSQAIIDEFAQRDQRIISIIHPQNKGLGAARNTGIQAAGGEYVWFVDSDDSIEAHSCETLYNTATKEDVDILFFSFLLYSTDSDGMSLFPDIYYIPPKDILCKKLAPGGRADLWEQLLSCGSLDASTTYISRLQLLKQFRFREGVYHEDTDFTPKLFFSAEYIYGAHYTPYFYRKLRDGSIMQSSSDKQRTDRLLASLELLRFCEEKGLGQSHPLARHASGICLNTELNAEQRELQQQIRKCYRQLPHTKAEFPQKSILLSPQEQRWLRFYRMSWKQKICAIAKAICKKLNIYSGGS